MLNIFYKKERLPEQAREVHIINLILNYSMIVATRPEPTVRPPSRSDFAYLET